MRLHQQTLHDAHLGLRGDTALHQCNEIARFEFGLPGHLPRRRPHQRAWQRLGDVADAVDHGSERLVVQPDRAVGQIVVVDEHEFAATYADELGDVGACGGVDIDLDAVGAHESARTVVVVDTDGEAMHAEFTGSGLRALLHDCETREFAVGVELEVGAQNVQPRRLEPLGTPSRQVPAGRLLQRGQQIVEGCVAEGVVAEVCAQAFEERFLPDVGDELLEHRGALRVGDAVEVDLDGGEVGDVRGDRVGGRQLILPIRP